MATGHPFDLPYMVEQWDDTDSHVEELIALTGDYRVARAAFEEAVKRPDCIVTLQQKTRVLADSREIRAPTNQRTLLPTFPCLVSTSLHPQVLQKRAGYSPSEGA